MLIFFIVTATFLKEKGIDVRTPDDSDESDSVPPPALLLSVQEDGFVRVNNVRLIDPGSPSNRSSRSLWRANRRAWFSSTPMRRNPKRASP